MTAVCSVGLDMIAVPGDTDAETLAALIADEVAIGVINHKTTAVRVIPVPGKAAGDDAAFGGLFGEMAILPDPRRGPARPLRPPFGGQIPAPLLAAELSGAQGRLCRDLAGGRATRETPTAAETVSAGRALHWAGCGQRPLHIERG